MKIFLISVNIAESPYPLYPLGMSVIANSLVEKGHQVIQMDLLQNKKDVSKILKKINIDNPDIIGISIRNIDNTNFINNKNYIHYSLDVIRKIKSNSEALVVLGGSGFSLFPEIILEKTGADYGFVGEAETTFREFIVNLKNKNLPANKVIYPVKNEFSRVYPALYSNEIISHYLKFGKTAPLQTKRGCLNKCIYCSYPCLEGREIRNRNPLEVVDDIVKLRDNHKVEMIFFTDSLFNDSRGHYIDVLKEMKRQNVKISWTAFFQPESFSDEVIELFKETGLEYVEMGADAATDTTLKQLGKRYTFSDIKDCIDRLSCEKIYSSVYYMFGGPGETNDTVYEGIRNVKSIKKAVSLIFTGIRIIPGTPLHKLAVKEGQVKPEDDLFDEKYYFSKDIDADWLCNTLKEEFKNIRTCIYPPDALESKLKLLHSIGVKGLAIDKLV